MRIKKGFLSIDIGTDFAEEPIYQKWFRKKRGRNFVFYRDLKGFVNVDIPGNPKK